jgi:hypothetical protein
VTLTVIGTGDGLVNCTTAKTPPDQPNIIIRVVTPLMAIGIRFANAYLTALVGLVTVSVTTTALPAPDFIHKVILCGSLAFAGPAIALIKDLITVFGRLEGKYPLLSGGV